MLTRLTSSGAAVATTPGSPKALQKLQNCIAYLWPVFNSQRVQRKTSQMDAIDCFTNELVSTKTKKWQDLHDIMMSKETTATATATTTTTTNKSATNTSNNFTHSIGLMPMAVASDMHNLTTPQIGLDIRLLSQPQLDNLLLSTLEIKNRVDFLYLIRQCILWKQLPSDTVLIACLKSLSASSHLQYIESLTDVCVERGHKLAQKLVGFASFKAMASWRSGGANLALKILHTAYAESKESEEARRMLRNTFRKITEETLCQKSEAVLVSLIDVARNIYNEHKDIFIIACIWKQCFTSDWFCDQKSATDLLDHYDDLQQLVFRRGNSLCASFLRNDNVDAVHRLIEIFLQYNQRDACSSCLANLFNYQYMRKDLRACAEIVKSCSELEIPLSELQNERFLSLFLDQSAPPAINLQKQGKEFQYKF